ncbi:MAG: TonB-dependent siderophore receptor, partial [Ottowia sp.]|nr:TonB-dependent siderophore receptor [Ottowia sp.]
MSAFAQAAPETQAAPPAAPASATPGGAQPAATLPTITVTGQVEVPQTKNDLKVKTTQIGKGTQELRDIPQSVTVMTEKLINDRNL